MNRFVIWGVILFIFAACQPDELQDTAEFNIDFEKFTLDNGLEVVFHIDRSDPVVAVALTAHVGSAREKTGRTGFAHLFEHLLFLESENLGKGGLDKLSAKIGGSGANGSTNRDRTNYFQTVPNDALEKMLWAEADKLGWFINTVTDAVLAKEKQVVKNEKRQGIDNRPYGHTSYVVDKYLYPEDHPYNWQVIGSLEDLQNATLQDVKDFFNRWYVPNNVTLVVAGDFDTEQAKAWIHKYFDEIPRGEEISALPKRSGEIEETVKLYHEDNFAQLPELTLSWPTVELYHPDSYPLDILTEYLSEAKKAPLYQVLVKEQQLTSNVRMYNQTSELAGQLRLAVRAYAEKDLDTVLQAIQIAFEQFEEEGISEEDLSRIKAGMETQFYNRLSSVLGKGFELAQYNIFAGDPEFINQDIQYILGVTTEDVMSAYQTYIKGKPFVATSFVPQGSNELALEGSVQAEVVEEEIVIGAEETFDASIVASYEPTPSSFDRSIEPPYGETPEIKVPEVWKAELTNGVKIFGIENSEVPLVQFELLIDGGKLLEDDDKAGVAYLTARLMNRGTSNRTPEELEAAIQQLGANISINAGTEEIRIRGNTLARNYEPTIALVQEMLLEPRWDEQEFVLLKQATIGQLQQQAASPNAIAENAYNLLIYGDENKRSQNILGNLATVTSITLDDLKRYYESYFSPQKTRMHIVGAVSKAYAIQALIEIEEAWENFPVTVPEYTTPTAPERATVYFYDVPGAKQSILRIGYPALAATDKDFYPANIMNYRLGGGGFASQLTQVLRESKGYTYGIRSNFQGTTAVGPFTVSSGVRSNITLEATQLINEILEGYRDSFTDADLETTQSYLIKSNARAFETAFAKLNLLENMSKYGMEKDYINQRKALVEEMTVEKIQELANTYIKPDQMIWLIVGDAATQLARMKELGYGDPVLMNEMLPLLEK